MMAHRASRGLLPECRWIVNVQVNPPLGIMSNHSPVRAIRTSTCPCRARPRARGCGAGTTALNSGALLGRGRGRRGRSLRKFPSSGEAFVIVPHVVPSGSSLTITFIARCAREPQPPGPGHHRPGSPARSLQASEVPQRDRWMILSSPSPTTSSISLFVEWLGFGPLFVFGSDPGMVPGQPPGACRSGWSVSCA